MYTGVHSKLMMNSQSPPHKRSNIERRVNKYLIIVFSLLFVAAVTSTSVSVVYSANCPSAAKYFSGQEPTQSFLNFITFLILYNSLVPISLYVTMDVIRIFQTFFIQWDCNMYFAPADQPALAKTGDLNEDLGQIEYVFSDKTGTLTENQMVFRRCSIAGNTYGSMQPPESQDVSVNPTPRFQFYDHHLIQDMNGRNSQKIAEFLECLSLCHTVAAEWSDSGEISYQAASPDEEALVIAASALGFSFQSKKLNHMSVLVNGTRCLYELVGWNEFNSYRKRMSVIVKPLTATGRPPVLYCKGADDVMLRKTDISLSERELVELHLAEFSVEGLRTLVLAKKELTVQEVAEFELK